MDNHVNNKVDMWALGCVIAELATGRVLFGEISTTGLFCRDVQERGRVLGRVADRLSASGVKLVAELLQPDPNQRPSAKDALSRPWVCKILSTMVSSTQNASNTVRYSDDLRPSETAKAAAPPPPGCDVEGSNTGRTQMHVAAANGDIAMVDHLKKLGRDIGVKRNNGYTPMQKAA